MINKTAIRYNRYVILLYIMLHRSRRAKYDDIYVFIIINIIMKNY